MTPEPHAEGHSDAEMPSRGDGTNQAGGETCGSSPGKKADGGADVDVILWKLAEWWDEAATQWEADRTDKRQALMVLAAHIDAPILLSEDENQEQAKSAVRRSRDRGLLSSGHV